LLISPSEIGHRAFPPLGSNVKALLVWPKFPPSFWGIEGMFEMIPEKSSMPPLGLITVAALCPPTWQLKLIDHAFEDINDEHLLWADLVMVSAMYAQRADARAILARARALGRRTFIGGPWASSEPEAVLADADHVLAGEAEEVFAGIAAAVERGTAQRLYRVSDKPDVSTSPIPRYDLLKLEAYVSMPVQFSRGCPFQCEFCDIITIYGRRPRTKTPAQVIAELELLRRLGWHSEVFLVDDNFIGNSKLALQLAKDLAAWQERNGRPFVFFTEASIDLADRPELMAAMVSANFAYVFVGIESPSPDALKETHKFQNLRKDSLFQVQVIHQAGLWVLGGFIVGFDSDDETIFGRQLDFISRAGIAWAMAGFLMAPPTTPLYDRMKREGRLIEDSTATTNFAPPNFRTVLPLPVLLRGLADLLSGLYEPASFFRRAFLSLDRWRPGPALRPPQMGWAYDLRVLLWSIWLQGVRSEYRMAYWRFLLLVVRRWRRNPAKRWLGFNVLLSAHHFLNYARTVVEELEQECDALELAAPAPDGDPERKLTAAVSN
jgi:radical SAM superfamily enzyme YgiQ (UPF0313 family)